MTDENPFRAPSPVDLPGGANVGGALEPVPIEPIAVMTRCWDLLVQHPSVVLGAVLLPAIPQVASSIGATVLDQFSGQSDDEVQILLTAGAALVLRLVSSLVGIYLSLGQARIFSRLARGLDAEVLMLFGEARSLPSAMLASLLMSMGILVGFCLLFVPGVVLAIAWSFVLYAMVDQDLNAIDALRESWRLTEGSLVQILVVGLALTVVGVLGSCATLCLGALVLIPLLSLAQGVMYHSLLAAKGPRPA